VLVVGRICVAWRELSGPERDRPCAPGRSSRYRRPDPPRV